MMRRSGSNSRGDGPPGPPAFPGGGGGGFTLLEMLAVILIIGIGLALILPNLDRITPKHRLRAGAREVAATIELGRHQSVTRAATYAIRYTLERDEHSYGLVLPEDEYGRAEALPPRALPKGVRIKEIILPDNHRTTLGEVEVPFSPTGESGAHIVVLENEREELLSVKFQPLLGSATFEVGEAEFKEYHGGL